MGAVSYINPRCVRMNYLQARSSDCNRRAHSFLSFRFRHNILPVVIPVLLNGKLGSGSAR